MHNIKQSLIIKLAEYEQGQDQELPSWLTVGLPTLAGGAGGTYLGEVLSRGLNTPSSPPFDWKFLAKDTAKAAGRMGASVGGGLIGGGLTYLLAKHLAKQRREERYGL